MPCTIVCLFVETAGSILDYGTHNWKLAFIIFFPPKKTKQKIALILKFSYISIFTVIIFRVSVSLFASIFTRSSSSLRFSFFFFFFFFFFIDLNSENTEFKKKIIKSKSHISPFQKALILLCNSNDLKPLFFRHKFWTTMLHRSFKPAKW